MKTLHKYMSILAVSGLVPFSMMAQSSVDAYSLTQSELRGTARFMSMGGAFTALGGDLSTLTQNPAGIGVYRGNDVGITLDVNFLSSKSSEIGGGMSWNKTHADVNNFGYVGTFHLNDDVMKTFSWGISYNRQKSFERQFRGSGINLETSLSNYIALCTDGTKYENLLHGSNQDYYNPYIDSDNNWLSILGANSGVINPVIDVETVDGTSQAYATNIYNGLFQQPTGNIPATVGSAEFVVRERGYQDEYSINFGGNLANSVFWGLGIGISDINYEQESYYAESLQGANVPRNDYRDGIVEGDARWSLENWRRMSGTGVNLKLGAILKPINEFRVGVAIHTPTWYSLTTQYNASSVLNATYADPQVEADGTVSNDIKCDDYTELADYSWNLRSPWRLMVGMAGVLGGRAIVSVDYEYQAYNKMKTSDDYGDFDTYNELIESDFKASNIVRVGAEYRVTPQFSLRAGYSYQSTNVQDAVKNNEYEILTGGCNPAYSFNNDVRHITAGMGYRSGGFYADLAYVNKHLTSTYHCFTPFEEYDGYWTNGAQAKITDNSNQVVLTIGYKF